MRIKRKFENSLKERNFSKTELKKIEKAISFIKKIDKIKIKNNLTIAYYLSESKLDIETIISGLLYKSEEFGEEKEIKKEFGEEIAKIVLGQRKLKEIKQKSTFQKTNPVRQILLTTIYDTRTIFVKLAAKLTNLENNEEIPEKKQKEIAKEALDTYIPIAERLGLELIKKELTDIAFKRYSPRKYSEIEKFLKESKHLREKFIQNVIKEFQELLKNKIKIIEIKGRQKQIYSIYQKIKNRKVPLHEQKDHFAIRIITDSIENCYNAINIIKNKYEEVPKTLKDYIKNPKPNGYKSIHVVLKIPKSKILEVQIRTKEMDEIAEEGIASHFSYKKQGGNKTFEKKTSWLKEMLNLNDKEAINNLKINLFKDKIYTYTPKGEAFELPINSTILDFAYRVHAEVGNKAIAGLVNEKFMPLKTKLKNGDIVEIITNKFQRPRRDWMSFAVTEKAKKIISREVKKFEKIPVARKYLKEKEEEKEEEKVVEIKDLPHHKINFAKCCEPIPPEEIIGIAKSNKLAIIHKKDCKWIKESKKAQKTAQWKENYSKPIKIFLIAKDRQGILADTLNTILRKNIKATEASAKITENDQVQCSYTLNIENLEKLKEVIKSLKKIKSVEKIFLE